MFENATLFALLKDKKGNTEVKRVPLDVVAFKVVRLDFDRLFDEYSDKVAINFDGSYQIKQDDELDEILLINSFPNVTNENTDCSEKEQNTNAVILQQVKEAIENAAAIPDFTKADQPCALFMGESVSENNIPLTRIAFQKFQKSQCISRNMRFYVCKDQMYRNVGDDVLSIPSDFLTVIYDNGNLKFVSAYYANQIFSLVDYYKEATQDEVNQFTVLSCLSINDKDIFGKNVEGKWYRKRIAFIRNNQILERNSVSDIQTAGKEVGLTINIEADKIVLPDEKSELRKLFAFLAEDTYKGIFTKNIYNTNSKTNSKPKT